MQFKIHLVYPTKKAKIYAITKFLARSGLANKSRCFQYINIAGNSSKRYEESIVARGNAG